MKKVGTPAGASGVSRSGPGVGNLRISRCHVVRVCVFGFFHLF